MIRLVLALIAASVLWQATSNVHAETPRKLALLVGCTRYVNNPPIRSLKGPQSDCHDPLGTCWSPATDLPPKTCGC